MLIYRNLFLILLSLLYLGCASENTKILLKEAPKPDNKVLFVVSNVMQEYRNKLQWKNECFVEVDNEKGIIETNWHPVHKGEVKRKIQIYVWGTIYRVDVWHKNTIGLSSGGKGYMSRLVEMNLQLKIDNKLSL